MTINKIKNGNKLTVAVTGRLDTITVPEMEMFLKENMDGIDDIVFDFSNLEYISSAGLRILLSTKKKLGSSGIMKVSNINETIMEIFEITGFSNILDIE